MRSDSYHGWPDKKIGYYREAVFGKCKKHLRNERRDLKNYHFRCASVCAYSGKVRQGFGSCSHCPDGGCEIKKDWEGREEYKEMLANNLSWHKNEMMRLKDLRSFGSADDTLCLSFVSQSAGRLGSEGNPPPHPSLLCWICDLHCGSGDRKAMTIIPSPLFSSSPPLSAPLALSQRNKDCFLSQEDSCCVRVSKV